MGRFDNQVVVVTGAGSGFGAAMTRRFAGEGATVVAADINGAAAEAVAEECGAQVHAIKTDVSSSDAVAEMIAKGQSLGGVNVLCNNAGFSHQSGRPWELEETEFDRVVDTNFKGVWLGVKHVVPHMIEQGGGVIINTASIGAVAPRPGVSVYNATKGAVLTLTMGLAVDLARYKIRVNALNPVAADTDFMKGALGVNSLPDANREAIIKGIPLRRLTEPEDVAGAAAFLASDDASFITGVGLPIDGGRSIS